MAQCISPVYVRNVNQNVPCGKCNFCLERRRNGWIFRLEQELKVSSSSYFLNLTYDDDHLTYNLVSHLPELCVRDVQLFLKRLRKGQSVVSSERLRYYLVGEYGSRFDRPHYHALMFNMDPGLVPRVCDHWRGGHVYVGTVTGASIRYVLKYHLNPIGDSVGRAPPFAVMSRRPGLGSNYLSTHSKWHLDDYRNYTRVNGVYGHLPRFYKEKIFEPWDRQYMARVAVAKADSDFALEISRLEKLHPDPFNYYYERTAVAHEAIVHKLNEKDKF